MQPNDPEQQWQQPSAAQSGAPYVAPRVEPSQAVPTQPQPTSGPVEPVVPIVAPAPAQQPVAPQSVQPSYIGQSPAQPTPVAPVSQEPEQVVEAEPVDTVVTEESAAADSSVENTEQVDQTDRTQDESKDDQPLIRWQATEYIQRERSVVWYVVLGIVTVALTLVAILLMKAITFAILVPVMAVALVIYTRRPPSMVGYTLSKKGLYVNDKLYPYADFKAFSVLSHAGNHSFQLIPRKRFQLGQTAYFTDDIGESVIDMLAARLPMKDDKPDMYDRISSKLKM